MGSLWKYFGVLKVTDFENASSSAVEFRVSTNPITSQVASVLLQGMLEKASNNSAISPRLDIIVKIESESIDTLNAKYPCSGGLGLRKAYTDFSTNPRWAQHLSGAKELFQNWTVYRAFHQTIMIGTAGLITTLIIFRLERAITWHTHVRRKELFVSTTKMRFEYLRWVTGSTIIYTVRRATQQHMQFLNRCICGSLLLI